MDWPADDQPFWMSTRSGPILSVPYPLEINDSPAQVFRQHPARDFEEMIIDQFDEMLHLSAKRPLVFGISLHPFIVGQPFRLRAFRRAMDHIMRRKRRALDHDAGRGREVRDDAARGRAAEAAGEEIRAKSRDRPSARAGPARSPSRGRSS